MKGNGRWGPPLVPFPAPTKRMRGGSPVTVPIFILTQGRKGTKRGPCSHLHTKGGTTTSPVFPEGLKGGEEELPPILSFPLWETRERCNYPHRSSSRSNLILCQTHNGLLHSEVIRRAKETTCHISVRAWASATEDIWSSKEQAWQVSWVRFLNTWAAAPTLQKDLSGGVWSSSCAQWSIDVWHGAVRHTKRSSCCD